MLLLKSIPNRATVLAFNRKFSCLQTNVRTMMIHTDIQVIIPIRLLLLYTHVYGKRWSSNLHKIKNWKWLVKRIVKYVKLFIDYKLSFESKANSIIYCSNVRYKWILKILFKNAINKTEGCTVTYTSKRKIKCFRKTYIIFQFELVFNTTMKILI